MTHPEYTYGPIDLPIREAIWPALEPVLQQPIVAVGSWCFPKHASADEDDDRAKLSIDAEEFIEFADGSRLSIRWDRGVTISSPHGDSVSEAEALHSIDMCLLPDEGEVEDDGEARSWHEYSDLLAAVGIAISSDDLKALPLRTQLSPDLRELLED